MQQPRRSQSEYKWVCTAATHLTFICKTLQQNLALSLNIFIDFLKMSRQIRAALKVGYDLSLLCPSQIIWCDYWVSHFSCKHPSVGDSPKLHGKIIYSTAPVGYGQSSTLFYYNITKPKVQFIKGAGSAHHYPECKHSLISPYSMPLDKEFFYLCLQWPPKMLAFSPAQYTNTHLFSMLLAGQLTEVLQCLTGQGQSAPNNKYSSTNPY
jgi:hypothetical protein